MANTFTLPLWSTSRLCSSGNFTATSSTGPYPCIVLEIAGISGVSTGVAIEGTFYFQGIGNLLNLGRGITKFLATYGINRNSVVDSSTTIISTSVSSTAVAVVPTVSLAWSGTQLIVTVTSTSINRLVWSSNFDIMTTNNYFNMNFPTMYPTTNVQINTFRTAVGEINEQDTILDQQPETNTVTNQLPL